MRLNDLAEIVPRTMENYFRRDWTELLSVFNAHGIDYMLVGGQAMAYLARDQSHVR